MAGDDRRIGLGARWPSSHDGVAAPRQEGGPRMAEICLPSFLLLLTAECFEPLHARGNWRTDQDLSGALFAQGRQTVTRWLCAADLSGDYHEYYVLCGPARDPHSVAGSSRSRLGTARRRHCAIAAPVRGTIPLADLPMRIDATPCSAYGGTTKFNTVLPRDASTRTSNDSSSP